MKILVTGASGFVGQNLMPKLKEKFGQENISGLKKYNCNLIDKDAVKYTICLYEPDVVIHLAGNVGGILANQENPGKFLYDNLMMGVNIIDVCKTYKTPKFIMLGTVCSYPKFTPVPFKESDFWNGYPEETNAPYGIAKKTLVEMLIAYRKQYGFNSTCLIPCNMYGPYDHFNLTSSHVIPALIMKVSRAIKDKVDKINVWGTGEASREFLYAEDCADAIIKAIDTDTDSTPINVGTGRETKIADLIELICFLMGYNGDIEFDSSKPDGQPRRSLDVSKAKSLLDFEAKTSLKQGLTKTIEYFYKEYDV